MEATLYAVYDPERRKFLRHISDDDYPWVEWVDLHEGVTLRDKMEAHKLKNGRFYKNYYAVIPVVLTTPTLQ